jgi:hypothetical protein
VGEASVGRGEGAEVLRALGLDNAGFTGASLAGKIDQLSVALGRVSDRGLKLTYVQKLLGDEARQMLPLLEMSRVQRQGLIDEHGRLRGNISAAAASAERQSDAMEKTIESFKKLGQTILIAVEPALVSLANALTDSIAAYTGPGGFEAFIDGIAGFFGDSGAQRRNRQRAEDEINKSSGLFRPSAGGGGGGAAGRPGLSGMSRLGMNTQLGTFNAPGQAVISTLRRIAESNDVIAREVASKRMHGMALT